LWDILKVQSFISVFVTGNADTGEEVNTKSLTNPNPNPKANPNPNILHIKFMEK